MGIRLIPNNKIDRKEWDRHIGTSHNRLIYAHSVYLDYMAEGWCALVDDKTKSVMPLPLKKKFGITYSYQPPFVQQLGIFSEEVLSQEIVKSFLHKVTEISKSINLYLNHANQFPGATKRCNYIIPLNNTFEHISKPFRSNIVTKPISLNLKYCEASVEEVFSFAREQSIFSKYKNLPKKSLIQFEMLAKLLSDSSNAFARKVISPTGRTLSATLFINDERRIYYVLPVNSPEGKASSSSTLLVYEAIRQNAGKNLLFDFEGSEIPGVKFFFEKFSPVNQPYFQFKSDRLNPIERIIKNLKDYLKK